MRHSRQSWIPALLVVTVLALTACIDRPITRSPAFDDSGPPAPLTTCTANEGQDTTLIYSGEADKEIDILFIIDNSASTSEKQANLARNFPRMIEAMRSPKLNNRIPNVHIGVISTDLGAGSYSLPSCEVSGGDLGRLQSKPRVPGCVPPSKPYIEYIDGVTNINNPSIIDPVEKVKQAFSCIAELGDGGCGFEMPLEAARRALDPKLNLNPGFLRRGAPLALVFLTDEDDCSAAKPQLFDPAQSGLADPLGPLTSFRCFEFGVACATCPGGDCSRTSVGPRQACRPAHDWLHKVEDYVTFFERLKPPGQVMVFAVAGPAAPVEVQLSGAAPSLRPSCQSTMGAGLPAVRLAAFVKAFGPRGHFNVGLDPAGHPTPISICSSDFSPALRHVGRSIISILFAPCLRDPPLTAGCGVACAKGDVVGQTATGAPISCKASCLEEAACEVEESYWCGNSRRTFIPRCPAALFYDASMGCGGACPCWRLLRDVHCPTRAGATPYRIDVMRAPGSYRGPVIVRCGSAVSRWGSAGLAGMGQCL